MTNGKIMCRVAGCHRGMHSETAQKRWGHSNVSLICGTHWRQLSRIERAVWSRLRRQARRFGIEHFGDREMRVWNALIRRAGA